MVWLPFENGQDSAIQADTSADNESKTIAKPSSGVPTPLLSLEPDNLGLPNTLSILILFGVPTENLDTNYGSDGNCSLFYEQGEGEIDMNAYIEEEVILLANAADPDEVDAIPIDAKIKAIHL